MNTKLYQIDQAKQNRTNLYLEPYVYQTNCVNSDLRHQYGISVAEAQTSLLEGTSLAARSEKKRLFSQARLSSIEGNKCFAIKPFSISSICKPISDINQSINHKSSSKAFPLTAKKTLYKTDSLEE